MMYPRDKIEKKEFTSCCKSNQERKKLREVLAGEPWMDSAGCRLPLGGYKRVVWKYPPGLDIPARLGYTRTVAGRPWVPALHYWAHPLQNTQVRNTPKGSILFFSNLPWKASWNNRAIQTEIWKLHIMFRQHTVSKNFNKICARQMMSKKRLCARHAMGRSIRASQAALEYKMCSLWTVLRRLALDITLT